MTSCICCFEFINARMEVLIELRICALQARRQPAALPAQSATTLGENERSILAKYAQDDDEDMEEQQPQQAGSDDQEDDDELD